MMALPLAGEIASRVKGRRTGNRYLIPCPVPSHGKGKGDRHPSLTIADGDRGLLVKCHAGCDSIDVLAELRSEFGQEETPAQHSPETHASVPPPAPTVYWNLDDAPETTQRACDIWRAGIPLWDPAAAPAVSYLTGRRLPPPYPETLTFAELPHPETGEVLPTLIVARHCHLVGLVRGIQRIFIDPAGGKYRGGTAKMSLGRIDGGRAELLWEFRPERLLIAEGVETLLSAARLFGYGAAWAMCGGFPREIVLRPWHRHVLLVADNDPSGLSERKARALARWIVGTGLECIVRMPSRPGLDANNMVMACGEAA